MKLSEWAEKQGIAYLTAYRWFKAGKLPVKAYQSDSGTIIVQDDSETLEQSMNAVQSNDIMSVILKKTVEFSKANASVEDFAAWILSNFSLKPNTVSESPRYSRVKPKPEDVQEHFKQFLKPKGEKPKPNMFVAEENSFDELVAKSNDLNVQELVDEIHKVSAVSNTPINTQDVPEVEELMKDISSVISTPKNFGGVEIKTYGNIAEGIITRSVDLTPQQLNYTGSADYTLSNSVSLNSSSSTVSGTAVADTGFIGFISPTTSSFQPTKKELDSVIRVTEMAEKPRLRRGRKPSKEKK